MDLISDLWEYLSCYEIPRGYAFGSTMSLLSAAMHRKLEYHHGHIEITSNTYIGLIGVQGSSKSTCCSFVKRLFQDCCPDLPVGPSRASPESIVKTMAEDKAVRSFTNFNGEQTDSRPYAFFINEFKNFVGRSPYDMLTFLTDIYDEKAHRVDTIIRGTEFIVNPCINLLCCETPEWITRNIKGDIISGGFGRRIIYIYETDTVEPRPRPHIPPAAQAALDRVKQRIIDCRALTGLYKWTSQGEVRHDSWYLDNFKRRQEEKNTTMRGYLRSKNVQLYKFMMLLDVCSDKPLFVFTPDLLDQAIFMLDSFEPNMAKLSAAAGRNELIAGQQSLLEWLKEQNRSVPEFEIKKFLENEMNSLETYNTLRHLVDSRQLIKAEMQECGKPVGYYTLPGTAQQMLETKRKDQK